jgi:hypothetical protein
MKFPLLLALIALILTFTTGNPIADPTEASSLNDIESSPIEKRAASCIVKQGSNKYKGTCVDVRKGKQCQGGLLVTGFCKGGNTNICCLKGYLIGARTGWGGKPKQGIGR